MADHYETLGIDRTASGNEIKSAYRRIVLHHHPDKSGSAESKRIFLAATDAYTVLNDPNARREYNQLLAKQDERKREEVAYIEQAAARADAREEIIVQRSKTDLAELQNRLSVAFARGQTSTAERLAIELLQSSIRQPMAHAVLGDIARARGDLNEAAKRYAYAAQFEPDNPVYQRRYEELLNGSMMVSGRSGEFLGTMAPSRKALAGGAAMAIIIAICSAFLRGASTEVLWSLLYFVAAASLGIGLSCGRWIERSESVLKSATGNFGVGSLLMGISVLNTWAGVIVYALIAFFQEVRIVVLHSILPSLVVLAVLFGISGAISGSFGFGVGTFVVTAPGGLGFLIGWLLGDALRTSANE
ncbi:DnaJ domain [Fimbriimonadaceae bacterium]